MFLGGCLDTECTRILELVGQRVSRAAPSGNPREDFSEGAGTPGAPETAAYEVDEDELVIELPVIHHAVVVLVNATDSPAAARTLRASSRVLGLEDDAGFSRLDDVNTEALKRKDRGDIVGHKGGLC